MTTCKNTTCAEIDPHFLLDVTSDEIYPREKVDKIHPRDKKVQKCVEKYLIPDIANIVSSYLHQYGDYKPYIRRFCQVLCTYTTYDSLRVSEPLMASLYTLNIYSRKHALQKDKFRNFLLCIISFSRPYSYNRAEFLYNFMRDYRARGGWGFVTTPSETDNALIFRDYWSQGNRIEKELNLLVNEYNARMNRDTDNYYKRSEGSYTFQYSKAAELIMYPLYDDKFLPRKVQIKTANLYNLLKTDMNYPKWGDSKGQDYREKCLSYYHWTISPGE